MNKRTLMIATAVAALTLGSSVGFAQAPRQGESHMNPASKNAPAEKIAPKADTGTHGAVGLQPKNVPATHMGQAPGSERNRMGENAQPKTKRETTGQAPSEQPNMQRSTPKSDRLNHAARPDERNNARMNERNERNRSTTGQGTMEKSPMENRSGATENRSGTAGGAHAAVSLSAEQKSKIHRIIIGERGAPRVGHVDFSVNVGTRVPRTIHLAPVPQDIVVIEPEWRGFEYFLVGDELVVVDPATLEIVAVLPA